MNPASKVKEPPFRTVSPADVLLIVCSRCETVLLDTDRARRLHRNQHEAVDAALTRSEVAA